MGEGSREQRLQSGSVGCCLCVGLYLHPHAGPAQTRNGIGQACCSVENLNLSRSSNSSEWTGTLLLCF